MRTQQASGEVSVTITLILEVTKKNTLGVALFGGKVFVKSFLSFFSFLNYFLLCYVRKGNVEKEKQSWGHHIKSF